MKHRGVRHVQVEQLDRTGLSIDESLEVDPLGVSGDRWLVAVDLGDVLC